MKMKQWLGLCLILSSLLLQVGYATTTTMETVRYTDNFSICITDVKVKEQSPQVEVNLNQDPEGKVVNIQVNNLYPGAQFRIGSSITNKGSIDGKITAIQLEQVGKVTDASTRLYKALSGYGAGGEVYYGSEQYEAYLIENYEGKVIKPSESLDLEFGMLLDESLEDLQNEQTEFQLTFEFAQDIPDAGKPDGGKPDGGKPDEGKPDEDKPDENIPDEAIPGGPTEEGNLEEIELPDEAVPEGPAKDPDNKKPQDTPEASSPSKLPQTGGVTPFLVYGVGIVMLGSGLILYKKKE
ncbi:MAG: LPXTG cell wall anchor domain-containing protein [Clostridiales bacterium]|nr:LPXTG cell wall anchor domain-containing protein [Clostridiales bacterium]